MSDSAQQRELATSVVFIDSNVPDIQDLLNGLAPGEQAFVLDPSSDGATQIAAILASEHLANLASISIVGHGSSGAIALGSTVLDDADLSNDAAAFAQIGSALAPGGDIALYACDTGAGAAGRQFIADLSQFAGGADVAAATHLVGGSDPGASWTLDTSTGAPVSLSSAPFTASALADFSGSLLSPTYHVATTDVFPTLQFGARIVTGDFNHDGKLDVLYQQGNVAGQGITLLLGNGNGTFQAPINQPNGGAFTSGPLTGIELQSITAGSTLFTPDLGGSGDIVVDAGGNTAPIVYQSNGTNYVQVANPFPSQQFTGRFVFADFNGDGLVDALNQTGNVSGTGITLYVNNGNGTFTTYAQPTGGAFTSGPLAGIAFTEVTSGTVYAVDTNGGGDKANLIIDDQGANTLPKVYLNSGSGFTEIASPFPTQQFNGRFVVGDFNNDGKVDILNQTGNQSGQGITLYEYNGDGTFTAVAKPNDSTPGAGDAPFTSGPFSGIDFTQILSSSLLVGSFASGGVYIDDSQSGASRELVPCYCPGTLIQLTRGRKPVENLEIGDRVMTMSGVARPIKWIGRRSYGGRFVLGRKDILPVCIKAGALAENVPSRDLWISPHHAMYLEGVLIQAEDLINGVSIVQAERPEKVEYFHIELETHDVIIAEGALSESFIDDDSRGMFHNAGEFGDLYPGEMSRPARYCAPRLKDGYAVEAARRQIAERAGIGCAAEEPTIGTLRGYVDSAGANRVTGWAQNVRYPEAPVCLNIYAGGRLIGEILANRYRADLEEAGLGSGRHGFEFKAPDGLALRPGAIEVRRALDGALVEPAVEMRGRRRA